MSNINSQIEPRHARSIQYEIVFNSIVAEDHAHFEFFSSLLELAAITSGPRL